MSNPLGNEINEEAEASKQEAGVNAFKSFSKWYDKELTPEAPIIKGLLEEGEVCAIVGKPKSGKSFLALQMALCVAMGKPFLGYEAVRQKVCVINAEVSEREYKRRYDKMCAQLSINPKEVNGVIAHLKGVGVSWNDIFNACKKEECKLAIIDPFYQISGIEESNQTQCHEVIREMGRFFNEGITLVVVFHASKGFEGDRPLEDMISGSNILTRFPESIIGVLQHSGEQNARVIKMKLRNYETPNPFAVILNGGAFERADELSPTPATARSYARKNNQEYNESLEKAKETAILAVIDIIKNEANYDGKGTPKGELSKRVSKYIKENMNESVGERKVGDTLEALVNAGVIEKHKSTEKHAKIYFGEVGIVERWNAEKDNKEKQVKKRNTKKKKSS